MMGDLREEIAELSETRQWGDYGADSWAEALQWDE